MTKSRLLLSSAALALTLSPLAPLARTASAQPVPPPPPLPELRVSIAPVAPPHVRHEVIAYDARPSKHHVWVKGYWHHDGGEWRWHEGTWVEPPERHAHWIAPQYHRVHEGYRYTPGHWSTQVVIHD